MMMKFPLYQKNDKGLATVEFVVIAFGLIMMVFFVVELTTLYFNIMSAQQAAYAGARVAIVSDPVMTISGSTPPINEITSTGIYGTACSDASAPCDSTTYYPAICDGSKAACSSNVSFTRILTRMQQFLGGLTASNVKITYAYSGLGFAGGPATPLVTVTIQNVPYTTGIINTFIGVLTFNSKYSAFTTLPSVSVTLVGEDLSTSGG